MLQQRHVFPQMPLVGRPESYYSQLLREADARGDVFAHEAAKVGQYVTLGLDPHLEWRGKLRYFEHAIKRHCIPPSIPDDAIFVFYCTLADFVRRHAGRELMRLVEARVEQFANRVRKGEAKKAVGAEVRMYFFQLLGHLETRPDWLIDDDWARLQLVRKQWI